MAFDPSPITDIRATVDSAADLVVSWTTSSPGSLTQVYLAGKLAWTGYASSCILPLPTGRVRIDVGVIQPGDYGADVSGTLPTATADRAHLTWKGGTYLDPSGKGDVKGFRVYGQSTPGGAYGAKPLADVAAYLGEISDGFGLGGFGDGGFGQSASYFAWTSAVLGPGNWGFRVDSYDAAGNESAGSTVTVTITGPPRAPAPFPDGRRLHISYNATTHIATLTWQAPPA